MLTATAAVAATPQTPVTNTQQPVKKADPKQKPISKEHHANRGSMKATKARSTTHATKVKGEKPAAKPEATKEPKKAVDKK